MLGSLKVQQNAETFSQAGFLESLAENQVI